MLLVEDDYDTRDAFLEIARMLGLEPFGVANGKEALALLHVGLRPCIIVLDIAMPEMDGFEFRRTQLADPAVADIPVAVMSGGGWATEADARRLGITVFLRKPVVPDELIDVFTNHCARRSSP